MKKILMLLTATMLLSQVFVVTSFADDDEALVEETQAQNVEEQAPAEEAPLAKKKEHAQKRKHERAHKVAKKKAARKHRKKS